MTSTTPTSDDSHDGVEVREAGPGKGKGLFARRAFKEDEGEDLVMTLSTNYYRCVTYNLS